MHTAWTYTTYAHLTRQVAVKSTARALHKIAADVMRTLQKCRQGVASSMRCGDSRAQPRSAMRAPAASRQPPCRLQCPGQRQRIIQHAHHHSCDRLRQVWCHMPPATAVRHIGSGLRNLNLGAHQWKPQFTGGPDDPGCQAPLSSFVVGSSITGANENTSCGIKYYNCNVIDTIEKASASGDEACTWQH
jgi:hypothetical protein